MSNIGDQSDIVPSDIIYLITLFIGKNWVKRLRIQPICHILSVIFSTLICNTVSPQMLTINDNFITFPGMLASK